MSGSIKNLGVGAALLLLVSACDSHEHGHGDGHSHQEGDGHDSEGPEGHQAHGDENDHGDEHAHSAEAVSVTRYSKKLELFAEYPPAIAGKELRFLAHLTVLDGWQALNEGSVALILTGATRVEARVGKAIRPGIFVLKMKAPAAGIYQGQLSVSGISVEDTVGGFEIVVHADEAAAAKHDSAPDAPEKISFLKEQQWQLPFSVEEVKSGRLVPTTEVAGEVTTPPSGQAEVSAAIFGRIVAPKGGLPRPGQKVKKGQLLALLAPAPAAPEEGARADLVVVEAESRVQAAKAEVERTERLIKDRAIAQRKVDDAQRELKVATEAVQAAKRARNVFRGAASGRGAGTYRVTSPISGVVVEVRATQGKSVSPGELLLRVVNLEELWVRARVPEQKAAQVRGDQDAAFRLPGLEDWFVLDVTGDDATASLVNIGQVVDPRSRTVDVIYSLSDTDPRLRVGALVRVSVPAGEPQEGLLIPRGAVIDDDGQKVAYVQTGGESFEERKLQLGTKSGPLVRVSSGVSKGERVVVRGGNVIRLSTRTSRTPSHGHVH